MKKQDGFLLIEVLIALFLITTASFVLLSHQLNLHQSLQRAIRHSLKINLQANDSESELFNN